jgi:ribosome-associated heat shock protein Hsp15
MSSMRLDKWLWAARFFKTRMLAKQAIDAGHVRAADGRRLKPATPLSAGQTLNITRGQQRMEVVVEQLHDRRQKAALAQQLYEETADSITRRALQAQQRADQPQKRPDKYARRELAAIKRRGQLR